MFRLDKQAQKMGAKYTLSLYLYIICMHYNICVLNFYTVKINTVNLQDIARSERTIKNLKEELERIKKDEDEDYREHMKCVVWIILVKLKINMQNHSAQ